MEQRSLARGGNHPAQTIVILYLSDHSTPEIPNDSKNYFAESTERRKYDGTFSEECPVINCHAD